MAALTFALEGTFWKQRGVYAGNEESNLHQNVGIHEKLLSTGPLIGIDFKAAFDKCLTRFWQLLRNVWMIAVVTCTIKCSICIQLVIRKLACHHFNNGAAETPDVCWVAITIF